MGYFFNKPGLHFYNCVLNMNLENQLASISKIKNGDNEALGIIYENHREEFIGWLLKQYAVTFEEARDIYQYAILIFYTNAIRGKLDIMSSSIKTYLFAIGKNQVLKRDREFQRFTNVLIDNIVDEGEFFRNEKHITEEQLLQVSEALNELGDPCKKLLEYAYFRKMNMEEITVALGYKNAATTKNLKYKCIQRLKKIIFQNSSNT